MIGDGSRRRHGLILLYQLVTKNNKNNNNKYNVFFYSLKKMADSFNAFNSQAIGYGFSSLEPSFDDAATVQNRISTASKPSSGDNFSIDRRTNEDLSFTQLMNAATQQDSPYVVHHQKRKIAQPTIVEPKKKKHRMDGIVGFEYQLWDDVADAVTQKEILQVQEEYNKVPLTICRGCDKPNCKDIHLLPVVFEMAHMKGLISNLRINNQTIEEMKANPAYCYKNR